MLPQIMNPHWRLGAFARVAGLVLAMSDSSLLIAGVTVSKEQTQFYGQEDVVLENEHLRVQISQLQGGRVKSFVFKPVKRDLTWWGPSGGLAEDAARQLPYPSPLQNVLYSYRVMTESEEEAAVAFSHVASSGVINNVRLEKTYRLRKGEPFLRLHLVLRNEGFSATTIGYRSHNTLAGDTDAQRVLLMPTARGILRRTDNMDYLVKDLTAGWLAALDLRQDDGLAILFDYNEVSEAFFWTGKNPTMEWICRDVRLPPKSEWSTEFRYLPFTGLQSVSHVDARFIAEAKPKDSDGITIRLYGLTDEALSFQPVLQDQKGNVVARLPSQPVTLRKGQVTEAFWKAGDAPLKDCVLGFLVNGQKNFEVALFPEALAQGGRIGLSAKMPKEVRRLRVEHRAIREKPVTARPGDRLPVLVLSSRAFEWGSRLHAITHLTGAGRLLKESLPSDRFAVQVAFENATFRGEPSIVDALARLYDYHVLVINDAPAAVIEPYVDDILRYVEKGNGLLVLGGLNAFGGRGADPYDTAFKKEDSNRPVYGRYYGTDLTKLLPVDITTSPDWIEKASRVEIRTRTHPSIVGVPINLTASYHKVQAREGTEIVLANEQGDPILVTERHGKGRLAALTVSDYENAVFWPDRDLFYERLLLWLADAKPAVDIRQLDIATKVTAPGAVSGTVGVANNGSRPLKSGLDILLTAPDGRRCFTDRVRLPAVKPNATAKPAAFEVPFRANWPAGGYVLDLQVADARIRHRLEYEPPNVARISLSLPRRNYVRGEDIPVTCQLEAGTVLKDQTNLTLRVALTQSANGAVIREQQCLVSGPGQVTVSLPGNQLAYGAYVCAAGLWAGDQQLVANTPGIEVQICPPARSAFEIGLFGGPPLLGRAAILGAFEDFKRHFVNYAHFGSICWLDDFLGSDYTENNANKGLGPISRHELIHFNMDTATRYQVTGCVVPAMPAHYGTGSYAFCQAHPQKAAYNVNLVKQYAAKHARYPNVREMYIEDEPFGAFEHYSFLNRINGKDQRRCDYCLEQFRKRFGYDMPLDQWTPEQALHVGQYYMDAEMSLFGLVRQTLKEINPKWKVSYIISPFMAPFMAGTWPWEEFKQNDRIWIDEYSHLSEYERMLFRYNLARTIGHYAHKPTFLTLGAYTHSHDDMKCQFWLAIAAGIRGFEWFVYWSQANRAWGLLDEDKWEKIIPYHRIASEYGDLFHQWRKPPSKVAILCSRLTAASRSYEFNKEMNEWRVSPRHNEYQRQLEKITARLYDEDIYPDIIDESLILADALQNYQVLIVAGVDAVEKEVGRRLAEFAGKGRLYLDKTCRLQIPGAVILQEPQKASFGLLGTDAATKDGQRVDSYKEIAVVVDPSLRVTKPERMYIEPLEAEGLRYAVLYNYPVRTRTAQVECHDERVRVVYDLISHARLNTNPLNHHLALQVEVPANDARLLAFLPCDITGIKTAPASAAIAAGEKMTINATLLTDSALTGLTPARVTVKDPRGRETPYGCATVFRNGKLEFSVATAINDEKGRWIIVVQDLITGATAQAGFTVN